MLDVRWIHSGKLWWVAVCLISSALVCCIFFCICLRDNDGQPCPGDRDYSCCQSYTLSFWSLEQISMETVYRNFDFVFLISFFPLFWCWGRVIAVVLIMGARLCLRPVCWLGSREDVEPTYLPWESA